MHLTYANNDSTTSVNSAVGRPIAKYCSELLIKIIALSPEFQLYGLYGNIFNACIIPTIKWFWLVAGWELKVREALLKHAPVDVIS